MSALITALLLVTVNYQAAPADSITLKYCYQQVEDNYPNAENIELQQQITDLNVRIVNTRNYPQISLNGRASYQSEVTEFGLPGGGGAPAVSKDQYEASLQVNQNIFNGGAVGIQKELERVKGKQEIQSAKIELHKIRAQIDQVYFGILLSKQQQEAVRLFAKDITERINDVRSKVENGVLLKSQQLILEAELLKAEQDSIEIASNVKAGYAVLGQLIGETISEERKIMLPNPSYEIGTAQPVRPELALFESSRNAIEEQKKLAQTKKLPSVSAFGTAGYGRPGFNFLNDNFHDYYMIGLRVNWNFIDFLNSNEQDELLTLRQKTINQNEASFSLQLDASLTRISKHISAIEEKIIRDEEIIEIREKIVAESVLQLENGVITAREYVAELTNANRARLSLFTNRIKLIQAQADYRTAMGLEIQ
jgi:outer membrane protein TolC